MIPQVNKVFYLKANYLKTTILHCGIKDRANSYDSQGFEKNEPCRSEITVSFSKYNM